MDPIRNIGPISRKWLGDIGIHTLKDLRRVGSISVYTMVRRNERRASLNLLWALEAAVRDIDCRALSPGDKEALKTELARLAAEDYE